jgi:ketosteroid isomerase-like protein
VERVLKKSRIFFLLAIMICAAFASVVSAQKDSRQANLDSLVQSERDFARTAGAQGTKEAFLAFAADDGIVFRRTAVNAKQTWSKAQASKGLLSWQPVFADVSRAGDLGYTTGPWEFREGATDEKPAGQGQYMTIWKRQPDGHWKFVLDFGTSNSQTSAPVQPLHFATDNGSTGVARKSSVEIEAARAALMKTEREFSVEATTKGTARAYLSHLADDARFFRQDAFPVVGKEQIRAALDGKTGTLAAQPAMVYVSLSGDLGYAYGVYESRDKATDSKSFEQGNYVRIWKRQPNRQWKIVVDVTVPVRPPETKP